MVAKTRCSLSSISVNRLLNEANISTFISLGCAFISPLTRGISTEVGATSTDITCYFLNRNQYINLLGSQIKLVRFQNRYAIFSSISC